MVGSEGAAAAVEISESRISEGVAEGVGVVDGAEVTDGVVVEVGKRERDGVGNTVADREERGGRMVEAEGI